MRREVLDRLNQSLDDRGREALGRLVHDQHLWVGDERAADREHLLLAAGQRCAADVLAPRQAGEQLVDALRRPLRAARRPDDLEVLVDRQGLEQPATLGDVADPRTRDLVRGLAQDLLAGDADRAARRAEQAGDRLAKRRLPHAVAPDQRDRLGAHGEAHALQDVSRPVVAVEVLDREQRFAHS
jgi:hypothetical protein